MRRVKLELLEFRIAFCEMAEKNGIARPSEKQIELFHQFTTDLLEVNQHTNLTAIRTVDGVISKHLIDSLLIEKYIPKNARVLDIGCGPGFPSIPLAIYREDLRIVSLDSTAKKIVFLQECGRKLELTNLNAFVGRAEDHGLIRRFGKFDAVVSRAVASAPVLCELCMSYLHIGGELLAMKGAKVAEEADELAHSAILSIMGGKVPSCEDWILHTTEGDEKRGVIRVSKEKVSDGKYPRPYATILKHPL